MMIAMIVDIIDLLIKAQDQDLLALVAKRNLTKNSHVYILIQIKNEK